MKHKFKKCIAVITTVAMILIMSSSAFAANTGTLIIPEFNHPLRFSLNKQLSEDEMQLYLPETQSTNQEADVKEIPDVVGSMVSPGTYFVIAGLGIAIGISVMAGIRKRKD